MIRIFEPWIIVACGAKTVWIQCSISSSSIMLFVAHHTLNLVDGHGFQHLVADEQCNHLGCFSLEDDVGWQLVTVHGTAKHCSTMLWTVWLWNGNGPGSSVSYGVFKGRWEMCVFVCICNGFVISDAKHNLLPLDVLDKLLDDTAIPLVQLSLVGLLAPGHLILFHEALNA